jgi:hypothetical protein
MASTKGWYGVEAGGDNSYVWDVEVPPEGYGTVGYYALNSPRKGEKQRFWYGKKGGVHNYPIHPTKNFEYNIAFGGDEGMNNYGNDARFVDFGEWRHKNTGDGEASVTLKF